jgi:hypothetical protein
MLRRGEGATRPRPAGPRCRWPGATTRSTGPTSPPKRMKVGSVWYDSVSAATPTPRFHLASHRRIIEVERSTMAKDKKSSTVRINCENCGGQPRNHDIRREFATSWEDQDAGEHGGARHQICQCRGCEAIKFRQEEWSTYNYDSETGHPDLSVTVYPDHPQLERPPVEIFELPDVVSRIYSETMCASPGGQA